MTSPKKRTIFPKQAIRNLRLQPLDAHQQALDGHQQALYGHPKPANGDFNDMIAKTPYIQKAIHEHLADLLSHM